MKVRIALAFYTKYDDGAGNSCVYCYNLVTVGATLYKEITLLDADVWKCLQLRLINPTAAIASRVAVTRTSVVGAPPAAAANFCFISTAGKLSFTTTNETPYYWHCTTTWTLIPTHTYTVFCLSAQSAVTQTLNVYLNGATIATGSPADDPLLVKDLHTMVEGDVIAVQWSGTAAENALLRTMGDMNFFVAEQDLVTREYTGQYLELAGKAVIGLAQVAKKQFAGVAAELADYLMGKDHAMSINIPVVTTEVSLA